MNIHCMSRRAAVCKDGPVCAIRTAGVLSQLKQHIFGNKKVSISEMRQHLLRVRKCFCAFTFKEQRLVEKYCGFKMKTHGQKGYLIDVRRPPTAVKPKDMEGMETTA